MAVLITTINRYQGVSGDSKPTGAPAGSTFYEVDTGDWFVWDGDSWEAYTFPLLDATSPELPTTDEKAALFASDTPSASNAFVTQSVLDAALTNLLSALPSSDPAEAGALWNDGGVLTVSAG
jgi:hypothetical protein